MKKKFTIVFVIALLLTMVLTSCSNEQPTSAPNTLPASNLDGKTLVQTKCTVCHTTDRIESKKGTLEQWQATVTQMKEKGAKLTAEEEAALVQYLAKTYK